MIEVTLDLTNPKTEDAVFQLLRAARAARASLRRPEAERDEAKVSNLLDNAISQLQRFVK